VSLINDFLALLYPRACEACGDSLYKHEDTLCNYCVLNLPKSEFHLDSTNPLCNALAGRVPVQIGASFYLFEKSGRIQRLLHAIKYEGQKELAEFIGKNYAADLIGTGYLAGPAIILPIPLHKKKLRIRGYNQSEWFARGLSAGLGIPMDTDILQRSKHTATQTKKKKFERWENVEGIFEAVNAGQLQNKHVILVDDVVTTGATIESAWLAIKNIPGVKVSVLSIAFASRN